MYYCDTSLIVAALTPEVHSEAAERWLSEQVVGALAISDWVEVELASALAMKMRRGALSEADRAAIWRRWQREVSPSMVRCSIDEGDWRRAATLVDVGLKGLRASDALHLAIAAEQALGMATLDADLAAAAVAIGLEGALVLDQS